MDRYLTVTTVFDLPVASRPTRDMTCFTPSNTRVCRCSRPTSSPRSRMPPAAPGPAHPDGFNLAAHQFVTSGR